MAIRILMETQSSAEQPLYSVLESKSRALIPKALSLLILGAIFYVGVLLNISLLELDAQQETTFKTGALLILTVLIIMGIILTFRKARQPYLFYRNRITHGKEAILYLNITTTAAQSNFVDKMFKTYSIPLSKNFFLRHIPETIPLNNYVQQLVDYSRKNQ